MQAFHVAHLRPGFTPLSLLQSRLDAPRGVFNEHQVLPVKLGKGLLVGTLDGGLQGRTQCRLHLLDQRQQRQLGV